MIKVFLVEDESIMREGLRDNVPWNRYGFEFIGEASDGEMALQRLRKMPPDLLITDIKMPFMDGLALSELVTKEFPSMKVIIISGYDDFEYARRAIKVGVEQYLLKPFALEDLEKVLLEVRDKIESEQEQKDYLEKYTMENSQYEQYSRRLFFEKIFDGRLSAQEIYAEAQNLSLELDASSFNLIFFSIDEKKGGSNLLANSPTAYNEEVQRRILRYKEYFVFRWNINVYGVLIMGEAEDIEQLTQKCVSFVTETLEGADEDNIEWCVAIGTSVDRVSSLSECYKDVNRIFSYRFLMPQMHVLNKKTIVSFSNDEVRGNYEQVDLSKVGSDVINRFLNKGQKDEVSDFSESYLEKLSDALKSKLFRDYMVLNIRFSILSYVESLNQNQEDFLDRVEINREKDIALSAGDMRVYLEALLNAAIDLRDEMSQSQGKHILKSALEYINENFTNENLSLNMVASVINVSPKYFSGVFSAEMDMTFVEYVTQNRMDMAKDLLRNTTLHSGEIAQQVGYRDPHYFSFVFKKINGISPREYRQGM